jgi:putative transferase (TIGR04331 family)
MERLLVSTAIEESWGESEPVLFLGEWCRIYSRRSRWEALDAVVAPYHWSVRTKVESDKVYLWELHERLIGELAAKLNEIHGVEHGIRYWRILIGPWLGYFTQTLFDRWEQIQSAISSFDVSETTVLRGLIDARCASDMDDYLGLGNSWQWNHHLSAEILTGFTDVGIRYIDSSDSRPALDSGDQDPPLAPIHRAAIWGSKVFRLFSRSSDFVVTNACLQSAKTEMLLQRRLGQLPILTSVKPVDRQPFDASQREWVLDIGGSVQTGFEQCLRSLIPRFIPVSHLEGYRSLVRQAEDLSWPSQKACLSQRRCRTVTGQRWRCRRGSLTQQRYSRPIMLGAH